MLNVYKVLEINDAGFVGVGGNSNAAGEIRIFITIIFFKNTILKSSFQLTPIKQTDNAIKNYPSAGVGHSCAIFQ